MGGNGDWSIAICGSLFLCSNPSTPLSNILLSPVIPVRVEDSRFPWQWRSRQVSVFGISCASEGGDRGENEPRYEMRGGADSTPRFTNDPSGMLIPMSFPPSQLRHCRPCLTVCRFPLFPAPPGSWRGMTLACRRHAQGTFDRWQPFGQSTHTRMAGGTHSTIVDSFGQDHPGWG